MSIKKLYTCCTQVLNIIFKMKKQKPQSIKSRSLKNVSAVLKKKVVLSKSKAVNKKVVKAPLKKVVKKMAVRKMPVKVSGKKDPAGKLAVKKVAVKAAPRKPAGKILKKKVLFKKPVKKVVLKKAVVKKLVAKKIAVKKPAVRKAVVKKVAAKMPVKKVVLKKAVVKKAVAGKIVVKKAVVKKMPAKKVVFKKPVVKKAVAKKLVAKKLAVAPKAPAAKKAVAKKPAVASKAPAAKKVVAKKPAVATKAPAAKKAVVKKSAVAAKAPVAKKAVGKTAVTHSAPAVEAPLKAVIEHKPVMMKEVLENLDLANRKIVVDCTVGLGGHSKAMLSLMPSNGKLVGFDLDSSHLDVARQVLGEYSDRVTLINANFSKFAEELKKLNIDKVDAVLMDLGLASPHVDLAQRGFSFLREGPLDMRFDVNQALTAADVVNTYSEKELIRIFKDFGEEKKAWRLATEITKARKVKKFTTTTQLAAFVEKFLHRVGHIHPATRIFQALRIEVNHELDVLKDALLQAVDMLKPGGRIAVISYHSLEDRIVKNIFRDLSRDYINLPGAMTTTHLVPKLMPVVKKPMSPSEEEVAVNSRSRSAKLRVAERI